MLLFTLTEYTGQKSSEDRTMTIATFSMSRRYFISGIISFLVSFVVSAGLWPFLGTYTLLALIALWAGLMWLLNARTRDSRRIPQYKALVDAAKARRAVGKFFIGVNRIDPLLTDSAVLNTSTVEIGKPQEPLLIVGSKAPDFHSELVRKRPR